jgi:nitrite reductase/ring-hydroxylating ferredoxin subunit
MSKSFKVAKTTELQDGQMKEVEIPGTEGKVLLSRVKGQFYATGNKCTRMSMLRKCGNSAYRLWSAVEEWRVD